MIRVGSDGNRQVSIMGIVNVTPDSFADGGRYLSTENAVVHGLKLIAEGADILDIGGESSRPGAAPVSVDEELARVMPVLSALHQAAPTTVLSIDTVKPEVAAAALAAGATIINDITALRDPRLVELMLKHDCRAILMHMQGEPRTMQRNPHYRDVKNEVRQFFIERLQALDEVGIARERLLLDPGIGFGKRLEDNLDLLADLTPLKALGLPVVIGASRKSFIGNLTDAAASDRMPGSVATAVLTALAGADMLRVHDVAATVQALTVAAAIHQHQPFGNATI